MRLASFNLENLFDRAKALNQDTIAEGKVILDQFARLNKLFAKDTYTAADKTKILDGLKDLGVLKDDNAGELYAFARIAGSSSSVRRMAECKWWQTTEAIGSGGGS